MTSESEKVRDRWERELKLGKCRLYEALEGELWSGAPVGPYVRDRVMHAIHEYLFHDARDLAGLFGLPTKKKERLHLQKIKEKIYPIQRVKDSLEDKRNVRHKEGKKYVLGNPDNLPNSIFFLLEEEFQLKAKTLHNIYYDRSIVKFPAKPIATKKSLEK